METTLLLPLNAEQLLRLNFEESSNTGYWSDVDTIVRLKEIGENTLQQYVYDELGNEITIGIPLITVGDLMKRYNSMTGYELKYWDKDYPQTAQ